jgi:ankyrin repeat protein
MGLISKLFGGNAELNQQLLRAVWDGDAAEVSALLAQGASASATATGWSDVGHTALMAASKKGHLEIVKLLIAKGARVNAREKDTDRSCGTTALMYASYECHPSVVEVLIAAGANVNARMTGGSTALMEVCRAGGGFAAKREIVEQLLASGADVNLKTESGWTAWSVAARDGHVSLANRLREAGAKESRHLEPLL